MRVTATMGTSAEPSQKMNCPADIEMVLGAVGLSDVGGLCEGRGGGCHSLPDIPSSLIGAINNIEICCCSDNL